MIKKFKSQYASLGITSLENTDPVEKGQIIYLAACKKLGIEPEDAPDVSKVRDKYRTSQLAFHKLCVIRDGITNDREADWNDTGEYKYGGWFWMNKPGFRFNDTDYDYASSVTTSGSRLCTFSDPDQEFFMTECVAIWADFMGGQLPKK